MISAIRQYTAKVLPNCRFYGISARPGKLFCSIAVKTAKRQNCIFFRLKSAGNIGNSKGTAKVLQNCRFYGISARPGKTLCSIAVKTAKRQNCIFFRLKRLIGNSARHCKSSAELPFLRHIG